MNDLPENALPPLEYESPVRRKPSWRRAVLIAAIMILAVINVAPWLQVAGVLPNSGRHRHGPDQYCYRNLRIIGLAIRMYASVDHDTFPPSLGEVLLTQDITSDVFICPGTSDVPAIAPTTQQSAALLLAPNGHHCSYFYVGDGLTDATVKDDDVIAFERPANHGGGMANVLLGNMQVERITDAARLANLQADCAAGVRPIKLRP